MYDNTALIQCFFKNLPKDYLRKSIKVIKMQSIAHKTEKIRLKIGLNKLETLFFIITQPKLLFHELNFTN
jgi:hypothetical protein